MSQHWLHVRNRKQTFGIIGVEAARIPVDVHPVQVFPGSALSWNPHLEFGHEAGELLVPVVERGGGRDDQERAPDVVSLRTGTRGERMHHQPPQTGAVAQRPNNRKPLKLPPSPPL